MSHHPPSNTADAIQQNSVYRHRIKGLEDDLRKSNAIICALLDSYLQGGATVTMETLNESLNTQLHVYPDYETLTIKYTTSPTIGDVLKLTTGRE